MALVILLDSSGPLHQNFHGHKNERIGHIEGRAMDIAAVYGYCEYVRKLTTELSYDRLIHVLDPEGGSVDRLAIYPQYKANRPPTHPVLAGQKALLPMVLEAFGQEWIKKNGVESDDVIASLANQFADQGDEVLIVSSDKDLMQLVQDGRVVMARYVESAPYQRKTHEFYEENDVLNKKGVRPDQIADFLAIVGDTVDNIPGVPGVGEKTAAKWLAEHGTLATLMTNAHTIKGAMGERLRQALPMLPLYRKLTGTFSVEVELPPAPVLDPNKSGWAKAVLKTPHWPDDLVGDLLQAPSPPGPKF